VQGLIVAHVGELVGDLARRVCPLCGMKFMEFRIGGRLGCPNDYVAFNRGLLPLLRRSQDGVTRHVGKVPRRPPGEEAARSLKIRADLRVAVEREDYEEAARLRDLLRPRPKDAPR
jgi:protein arginine kinase activator